MPAKQGTTFQQIMTDLKARRFSPIYILEGEESYYIDKIADYIAENVLTSEERDFNQTIVFGSDTTDVAVTDIARRYPMMSKYQVVIVKEAQTIKSLDHLTKYVEHPMASTILVWCYKNGKIDGKRKLITAARARGVVFESDKVKEYNLNSFVVNYLKAEGVSIDPKASQMIADHIGSDLNRLTSELDKLLIALSAQTEKRITAELVEEKIGISKDFNDYELLNAIQKKDVLKANQIINYFDSIPNSKNIYQSIPKLFSFFQALLIIQNSPQSRSENGIKTLLGLKDAWRVKYYLTALSLYPMAKTLAIISKLREIDNKLKGNGSKNTSTGELMRELIFFILH